ncbi:MAG: FAD-dependent oxidoreductase [Oscillospiraceae bacterium]|nr:FAD-dependent oxidoreductase [Oscillospiraceae bacterium]
MSNNNTIQHNADLCVVGGGLSGICAAISAARLGLKVVIMQDRPMFGGNASSEIRMWICGAHGENNRETGLVEEFTLENFYINPMRNYSLWDSVLYEKVAAEKNIEILLNCVCYEAEMENGVIKSVEGYQSTTQTHHIVNAKYFCDCSGDSVLADLTGAEYRKGREASGEFGENIAPQIADKHTMGMSCLLQIRNTGRKSKFTPPKRAYKYTKDDLPYRTPNKNLNDENFWYIELGGMDDSIKDTEILRDELLKTAFGIWDYIKNSGDYPNSDVWELDWLGFLPGKRESLRYVGDYIMTQNDVRSGGKFEDIIAYGGWTMDDHNPGGFLSPDQPTIYHSAPSPYGIAYRCIYSRNIANLFFAGRNISVTHSALSSTRVMATCALLGQAAGTAAYVAIKNSASPREIYQNKKLLKELQNILQYNDSFLPYIKREVTDLTKTAKLDGKFEVLRNGFDRPTPKSLDNLNITDFDDNGAYIKLGEEIKFMFDSLQTVNGIRFVFDSDLDRKTVKYANPENNGWSALTHNMMSNRTVDFDGIELPETLVSDIDIYAVFANGVRKNIASVRGNYQRFVNVMFDEKINGAKEIVIIPVKTTGKSDEEYKNYAHIFSIDIL